MEKKGAKSFRDFAPFSVATVLGALAFCFCTTYPVFRLVDNMAYEKFVYHALSISSVAAEMQYPILLVQRDGLSDVVKNEIAADTMHV